MTSRTPKRRNARQDNLEHGAAGNFDERLGAVVGKRPQARTQTGRQNHRLHRPIFSSSICRTTTFTLSMPSKCIANCSAR